MLQGMHNSELFLTPLRRQEAVISSRMEGTISTLDEVLRYEAEQGEDGEERNLKHRSEAVEVFLYHKAMQQPDVDLFVEAMQKEIIAHESRGHWDIVGRSSLPPGTKTIQAIWTFKRKRFPDGRLNKHKARICAHGGIQ